MEIKKKVQELLEKHFEKDLVKTFIDQRSDDELFNDFVKQSLETKQFDINENDCLDIWADHMDDWIEYRILSYAPDVMDDDEPAVLDSFVLRDVGLKDNGFTIG